VHRLSSSFDRFTAQLRYRAKQFIGRHPCLYQAVFHNRSGYEDLLVNDDTDICIEGFPRSANSFAVAAFRHAQDEPVGIAHHNHVPAPVLTAVQKGLPTVVLIRDPVEAVISSRGLQLQIGAVEDKPMPMHVTFKMHLQGWLSFYRTVERVKDRGVIAPFEDVIDDFGSVIERVNQRVGTSFALFNHTSANVEIVRNNRGYHALPSTHRDRLKETARDAFHRNVGEDHPIARTARRLLHRFRDRRPVT
jgi:hypothetical protein